MKLRNLFFLAALSLGLAACDFDGGVEQGRCVAFDADNKQLTVVVDTTLDQLNPHYNGKVDTFKLPLEARDMGPAPVAGDLLMVELDKNMVMIYDPATRKLREIPVEFTNVEKDVTSRSPKLKGKDFPILSDGSVTIYSPRLESIITFKLPPDALDLPRETWTLGDEVRIAFRNEKRDQAIRIMNVTKTNIFTR